MPPLCAGPRPGGFVYPKGCHRPFPISTPAVYTSDYGAQWIENHSPFTFWEDTRCTFFHNLPAVASHEADKQVVPETSIETGTPQFCATPTKGKTKWFVQAIARAEVLSLRCPEEFEEEGIHSCWLTTKPFAQNSAEVQRAMIH